MLAGVFDVVLLQDGARGGALSVMKHWLSAEDTAFTYIQIEDGLYQFVVRIDKHITTSSNLYLFLKIQYLTL